MPEIQNPESIAIVARVQEIIDDGKNKTTKEVDDLLNRFRGEMLASINQVAAGMKAPVNGAAPAAQPNGQNGQASIDTAAATPLPATPEKHATQRAMRFAKLLGHDVFGLPTWEPAQVPFTKEQALSAVATGSAAVEVLSVAERGLTAIGIEAAFERRLVQAPKKGLSTWQVVGLAVAGTAAAGGAVAAGLYLAEVGPFAPKASTPTEG